jgi:transcriptional regulator with XRE-family HTH domain
MDSEDEVRRATRLLEVVIRVLDVTPKELERRLGMAPGEVCRILSGRAEPRLRDVLDILRALDLEPAVFFDLLEAPPGPGEPPLDTFLRRLDEPDLAPFAEPGDATAAMTDPDLEALVERAVRLALDGKRREPGG